MFQEVKPLVLQGHSVAVLGYSEPTLVRASLSYRKCDLSRGVEIKPCMFIFSLSGGPSREVRHSNGVPLYQRINVFKGRRAVRNRECGDFFFSHQV